MWHISVSRAVNAMPALSQSHTMGPGEQRGGEWRRLHASECMPSHEPCPDDESVREGGTPGRGRRSRMYGSFGRARVGLCLRELQVALYLKPKWRKQLSQRTLHGP